MTSETLEFQSNQTSNQFFPGIVLTVLLAIIFISCTNSNEEKLHSLIDETEEFNRSLNPFAENEVDGEDERLLWSESLEDQEVRFEFWSEIKNRLMNDISRDQLGLNDQITYDSFVRQVRHNVRSHQYLSHLIPINHEGGFYNRILGIENRGSFDTVEDYELYLDRLRSVPKFFDEHVERMRVGIDEGVTLPRVIFVDDYNHYIVTHVTEDPAESRFFEPFLDFPNNLTEEEQDRLREEAVYVIGNDVHDAYLSFVDFLNDEYIPNARETIATIDLPDGEEYYNHLIEYHTTLPMSAEEVHQIGLDEVERIRGEMFDIIDEVDFAGSFDEFLEFLRTDPQFFVDEPDDLLKEGMWHAKRMDGKLPEAFHLSDLPRRPYGVEPVPDHLAPRYTGGRYSLGGGTRAGFYWINTYNLPSRTLYTLEALTYHEAVPGHHLQIALHQERDDLPRRVGGMTAYTEGWALYAERLGLDLGLYEDPYSNFGRLTYEMWRACRLVVDTGMHALGWTRQQAVDFMTENTALSHHEIDTEINRYIAVPGQALAYKLGEIKIMELRAWAEEELGNHYDIRDFHTAVLKHGPVTIPVLEEQVREFILEKKESLEAR